MTVHEPIYTFNGSKFFNSMNKWMVLGVFSLLVVYQWTKYYHWKIKAPSSLVHSLYYYIYLSLLIAEILRYFSYSWQYILFYSDKLKEKPCIIQRLSSKNIWIQIIIILLNSSIQLKRLSDDWSLNSAITADVSILKLTYDTCM